jgi:Xaa-Pro dipeptidase
MSAPSPNRRRADRYMTDAGVDALVTWAPVSVRYLTGYWCWIAPLLKERMVLPGGGAAPAMRNIAVLPSGGDPILIVDALWVPNTIAAAVADVRFAGAADIGGAEPTASLPVERRRVLDRLAAGRREPDPFALLAEALREQGLDGSRIGVELEGAEAGEAEGLRARLPRAELLDCTDLLRLVRAVKTASEVDQLARAAQVAEDGAVRALQGAVAGTRTSDVAQRFRELVAAPGADFDHFAFGPSGLGILTEGGVELGDGDAMYADFGCVLDGWFSDSGTTLCVGEPTPAATRDHEVMRDCVDSGAAMLRPGQTCSAVQAAMADALAAEGIGDCYPHGHGVGLEVRDHPLIMPASGLAIRDDCIEVASDLPLEEGMVVNLEAPLFTPGVRSAHCERTFVLTAEGCRPLVAQDRHSPVVAGDSAAR